MEVDSKGLQLSTLPLLAGFCIDQMQKERKEHAANKNFPACSTGPRLPLQGDCRQCGWLSRRIGCRHGRHFPLQGTMMTNSVRAPCFAMTLGSAVDTSGDTSVSFLMTHSMPNVLDSSTASSSFSWSISNDEYGGKSSLLKQV